MQFTVSFELYIDIGTRYIPNMKLINIIGNRTETRQKINFIAVEVFIYIYLFIFDYRALFVCVADRTCLEIAIPASCFNILRSAFGLLFCLLDRKLILGSKTIWKSMGKFPYIVWSVAASLLRWIKKQHFLFLETAHRYMFWNYFR